MYFSGIADEAGDALETQIQAHKELGWNHIELRNINGVNFTDHCDRAFEEVVGKLSDAGLQVSCFASQLCNWARPITKHFDIDRDELQRAIPRMQKLGCNYIRIMSYPNAGWPEQEWKEEVFKRLRMLADMAENGGIVLAHENCDGYGGRGPAESLELLDRVDSPNLKLLYDTGNPVPHGQDAWEYYSAIRDHIVYVHIKDATLAEGSDVTYTYCGKGDGKVRQVLSDLKERGYDGYLSIEPHLVAVVHEGKGAGDKDAAASTYIEYGRRLVKLVEELG